MAKYSRQDIEALCKRLEIKASVMDAAAGRDLMAASLLLKLMVILGDVQEVETRPPGRGSTTAKDRTSAGREAKD
jgi:hypothetical protein